MHEPPSDRWQSRSTRAQPKQRGKRGGRLSPRRDGDPDPFAAVARLTPTPTLITDAAQPDHPVIFANDAFCRLTGYQYQEIMGRNCRFLQGPATDPMTIVRLRTALAAAEPINVDIRNYRKNGEAFWNRLLIAPVNDADGKPRYFVSNQIDVSAEYAWLAEPHGDHATGQVMQLLSDRAGELAEANARLQTEVEERRRVEAALQRTLASANESQVALMQSEMYLRSVLDTVPDAMIVIGQDGRIQSFSQTAERLFGYTRREVIGHDVSMLMPPPERERHGGYMRDYLETGDRRIIGRGRIVIGSRSDGSVFPMELTVGEMTAGDDRWFTGFARDVTEREETAKRLHDLQAELIHMSRFTAMGEMASALAHELNQPLTAVVGYLNGSRRLLMGSDNVQTLMIRDAIERASDQALRAGQIIRRLRQFVARGETERHVESLTRLIEEACALALVGIGEAGVRVSFALDPRATFVVVDKVQIHQVLLNLVRNAIEAMQETAHRTLTIATARREPNMAEVSVADTGLGIAPAIASQLFQPFVSTKPQGMGVGLSISRTIIESHGGHLWAEPNPGGGTVFRLTLRMMSKEDLSDVV
ncbi:MAG TPA: PAS domain S-box protein [Rhodopila sp.]